MSINLDVGALADLLKALGDIYWFGTFPEESIFSPNLTDKRTGERGPND